MSHTIHKFASFLVLLTGCSVASAVPTAVASEISPDPTQNELRSVLIARSVADLEKRQSFSASLRTAQETCESELRAHLLPRSCFRELALKKRDRGATERRRLAQICIETAKISRSRLDLEDSLTDLPIECGRMVIDRREDLQYMDAAEHPEMSVRRTRGLNLEKISSD